MKTTAVVESLSYYKTNVLFQRILQDFKIMSLVLICKVACNPIFINKHAHGTNWHQGTLGSIQIRNPNQLDVLLRWWWFTSWWWLTQSCPGALSPFPSVWLHSWAQEPTLCACEGMQLLLEPLRAQQGEWSPPLGLGTLVASCPQVPAAWHPESLPLLTTSDWSCTLKDLWQHCTLCDTVP